ncbi:MAG: hypothetical protein JWQ43_1495 [Glaciihabitans sp.]|nr:hypothetical protein [Glaciihabitans sp.]
MLPHGHVYTRFEHESILSGSDLKTGFREAQGDLRIAAPVDVLP